jgi:hypothetical protein
MGLYGAVTVHARLSRSEKFAFARQTVAGVDGDRVYSDKLSGTSTCEQRPGLAALLD